MNRNAAPLKDIIHFDKKIQGVLLSIIQFRVGLHDKPHASRVHLVSKAGSVISSKSYHVLSDEAVFITVP